MTRRRGVSLEQQSDLPSWHSRLVPVIAFIIGVVFGTGGLWQCAEYRLNKRNAELDQRAWVNVTKIKLEKPLTISEKPIVTLIITNSGKTPALNVRVGAHMYVSPNVMRDDKIVRTGPYSEIIIAPNSEHTGQVAMSDEVFAFFRLPQTFASVTKGDYSVYVDGKITYCDIFGKKHFVTFCSLVNGITMKDSSEPNALVGCEGGDSVDRVEQLCDKG
jgi:hypothetical protein